MNSLDPNNTYDNRLGVWALTNREHIAQGVIPNLSATVIGSEAYAMPVNAQTPAGFNNFTSSPTTGVVTADFDAMQEVQYVDGYLYGVAWFKVAPSVSGGVISSSTHVAQQGYISSRGLYLLYPHIEHSRSGNTAIVFSIGGPGTYLSAAYAVQQSGWTNFGGIKIAANGAAPDNGFTGTASFGGVGRWGDYSAGQLDPSGNGIWFTTQYIPNNGDGITNWGNRVFEVAA